MKTLFTALLLSLSTVTYAQTLPKASEVYEFLSRSINGQVRVQKELISSVNAAAKKIAIESESSPNFPYPAQRLRAIKCLNVGAGLIAGYTGYYCTSQDGRFFYGYSVGIGLGVSADILYGVQINTGKKQTSIAGTYINIAISGHILVGVNAHLVMTKTKDINGNEVKSNDKIIMAGVGLGIGANGRLGIVLHEVPVPEPLRWITAPLFPLL